jgi:hypothetical protein
MKHRQNQGRILLPNGNFEPDKSMANLATMQTGGETTKTPETSGKTLDTPATSGETPKALTAIEALQATFTSVHVGLVEVTG